MHEGEHGVTPKAALLLGPGECRRVWMVALLCRCARCDHEWQVWSRSVGAEPEPPRACARCKTPAWRTKPGTVRRGRPPKAQR